MRRWATLTLLVLLAGCGTAGAQSSSTSATTGPDDLLVACVHHPGGQFEQVQVRRKNLQALLDDGGIFPVPKDGCASGPPSSSSTSTSTTRAPCVDCVPNTQGVPTTTTSSTSPTVFSFNGASPVCSGDVPFIAITFSNNFPQLDGHVGKLTMTDITGQFISEQDLVFQSGTTVRVLYPGATIGPDGEATDWPGWRLTNDGLWVTDPTDAIWRAGINLSYTVNPTATAFVAYPPESAACASPENPPGAAPPSGLPRTD